MNGTSVTDFEDLNLTSLEEVANHPIKGASWETFVIEDIIRREKLERPHSQFYFWRTSAGAEVDFVIDRGSTLVAIEIKCGRGGRPETVRQLRTAMEDIGVSSGWIVDEDEGSDPLAPRLRRRGFAVDLAWLPT
jgi:predicted AAA+ superfamily ATPase